MLGPMTEPQFGGTEDLRPRINRSISRHLGVMRHSNPDIHRPANTASIRRRA